MLGVRLSGAVSLRPLCAFIARARTYLPSHAYVLILSTRPLLITTYHCWTKHWPWQNYYEGTLNFTLRHVVVRRLPCWQIRKRMEITDKWHPLRNNYRLCGRAVSIGNCRCRNGAFVMNPRRWWLGFKSVMARRATFANISRWMPSKGYC